MAPASKLALLNHGIGSGRNPRDGPAWSSGAATPPRQMPQMSKAERLLGVADTSGMKAQLSRPGSDASRRSQKRGQAFTSAFADLKGALSGATRYATTRRRTSNSPGFPTATDSDSSYSVASPTFDTSTSASTLPSYYEPPISPYFSQRGSESPSSPRDAEARHADARLDYHAALNPGRWKGAADMPSISEHFGPPEDAGHGLPPLQMAPLSPVSKPGTPKTMSSFAPINRIRSPSTLSVASEATAKAKFFGRRNSKHVSKEAYLDNPSTPSTEHQLPMTHVPIPPMPTTRADSAAIEQWLARADLARRPSTTSTATRSTMYRAPKPTPFSPTSSQLSVKTLTTQKDVTSSPRSRPPQPPLPPNLRSVRSSDELDNFAVARQQPGFYGRSPPDLRIESVLSLSSSEEESSEDEAERKRRDQKAKGDARRNGPPTQMQRTASLSSTATTAPQFLEMQRQAILQKNSQKKGPKRRQHRIVVPPQPQGPTSHFDTVEWPWEGDSEQGRLRIDAYARTAPAQHGSNGTRKAGRKPESIILSPTSKVMVVSKKEEKLLAQMRDSKNYAHRASTAESDSTSSNPPTPIISVSPPRRPKRGKATEGVDEMLELSENRVITFPTPPTLPMIGNGRGRSGSMSLALSKEALSELTGLPEVVGSTNEPPPLPTGTILSPDAVSRVSTNYSVSDFTSSVRDGSHDYFDGTAVSFGPQELQGSFPDLTSALRADINRKREKRRGSAMVFATGLENRQSVDVEGLETEDDLSRYVMAAVL